MDGSETLQIDAGERTTAVIDLFCGAGGLAYGLKTAGLTVKAGIDLDPSCKHPLETNTGADFACRDVSDLKPADIRAWFGDADVRVLAGCAPCQPFSTAAAGRRIRRDAGAANPRSAIPRPKPSVRRILPARKPAPGAAVPNIAPAR